MPRVMSKCGSFTIIGSWMEPRWHGRSSVLRICSTAKARLKYKNWRFKRLPTPRRERNPGKESYEYELLGHGRLCPRVLGPAPCLALPGIAQRYRQVAGTSFGRALA